MPQRPVHQCECALCQSEEDHPDKILHHRMNVFFSRLDEQQRRWYAALEAQRLGHGGATLVSQITGSHIDTIRRGLRELEKDLEGRPVDRVRLPGGGRKRIEEKTPTIVTTLETMVEDSIGGDPMGTKIWVSHSLRHLTQGLQALEYQVCPMTVGRLLCDLDYSLQANCKRFTGDPHPDQDLQFRYIARVKRLFWEAGYPVICVDAKKRELIGNFKNSGRVWCHEPEMVNVYDFRSDAVGVAIPYGIYDPLHNFGAVYVGTSAETGEFAVDAIGMWYEDSDRPTFPREDKLLILCDGGGSNGYRPRLWKRQLQVHLADRLGIGIMVCHFPTGASKWNPIEHRLFNHISLNWAGKPLRTYETMLGYIRGTTTTTGLKVKAELVDHTYQTRIKVSDKEMAALNLTRRPICPQWNYMISPRSGVC